MDESEWLFMKFGRVCTLSATAKITDGPFRTAYFATAEAQTKNYKWHGTVKIWRGFYDYAAKRRIAADTCGEWKVKANSFIEAQRKKLTS